MPFDGVQIVWKGGRRQAGKRGVGGAPAPLFSRIVVLVNNSSALVGWDGVVEYADVEVEGVQSAICTGFPFSGGVRCKHFVKHASNATLVSYSEKSKVCT
jgi:hypothetical protein